MYVLPNESSYLADQCLHCFRDKGVVKHRGAPCCVVGDESIRGMSLEIFMLRLKTARQAESTTTRVLSVLARSGNLENLSIP